MPRNEQAARSRLLGGCDAWHAVPLPHTKFLSHSDHEFNLGVHRPELRSEVLACSRPTELGTLDSYRFGPFESHGGGFHAEKGDEWSQSWLRVSSYENFPPGPYQGGLGRYEAAVLGYVIAPVDLNGTALMHPPLHVHHANLRTTFDEQYALVFNSHSVSDLPRAGLKQRCAESTAPQQCASMDAAFHVFVDSPLPISLPGSLSVMVNDVRPPRSPRLRWYMHVAWEHTSNAWKQGGSSNASAPPGRPADATLSLHSLHHQANASTGLAVDEAFDSLWIPPHQDSAFFYTGRLPRAGKLSPHHTTFHGHSRFLQRAYLFQGTPEQLGLQPAPLQSPCENILPQVGLADNRQLSRRLHEAVERNAASGARLVCSVNGVDFTTAMGVEEAERVLFASPLPMRCDDWEFDEGTPFVAVSLNGPLGAARVDLTTARSQQHSNWQLYYHARDGGRHLTVQYYSTTAGVPFPGAQVTPTQTLLWHYVNRTECRGRNAMPAPTKEMLRPLAKLFASDMTVN